MKDSIRNKLERMAARHEEVAALMAQPGVADDPRRFRELSQEYARLEPLARAFGAYRQAETDLGHAAEMAADSDPAMRGLAEEERHAAEVRRDALEPELLKLLLPKDPHDDSNIYLEVRRCRR